MRRIARDLVLAVAVLLGPTAGHANAADGLFGRALRDLDGAQFLADVPIWICDLNRAVPGRRDATTHFDRWFVADEENGRSWSRQGGGDPPSSPVSVRTGDEGFGRVGDLVSTIGIDPDPALFPPGPGTSEGRTFQRTFWRGGLRAGSYSIHENHKAESPVVARFRVVQPRGSELSVRAALGRASRLASSENEADRVQAAGLYEAVLDRYPNTAYVTLIYAGLWRVRAHTRAYAADSGAWLDRIFATFHDTCFGVWALDRFMADMPEAESRPLLRRLVGLYPDTKLARAAGVYL